jgi:uncharacterized protein HemY
MNDLQNVLDMWKKDSVVDRTEPGRELINIPILHSKYLTILSNNRKLSKNEEFNFNKLKRLKWEYYTGKMDQKSLEQNGWQPFPYILKADVSIYMESDEDLFECKKKKEMHDEIVDVCMSVLKELNSRTFQLKDFIAWERFVGGN